MGQSLGSAQFVIERRLRDAARGDTDACYDLGMIYSTGASGTAVDLIAAHKWFNLAAIGGSTMAQACRAEIADDMTAREIVEAQRQARAWLATSIRRAA